MFEQICFIVTIKTEAMEEHKYNEGRQANEAGRREVPLEKNVDIEKGKEREVENENLNIYTHRKQTKKKLCHISVYVLN